MAIKSKKVYCHKRHADFQDDNGDNCLLDTIVDGELIEAVDRPEAAAYIEKMENGITKYYIKRDLRRSFFNPRTSDVNEHNIEQMGQKKWSYYSVNKDCMFHYLRWLDNGFEGELSNARRAQQS